MPYFDSIQTILNKVYPIGSVVTFGVSTNPATLLGIGTWTAIAGKVIVGLDSGQTEFDTLDETGGAKTVTLTSAQSGVPAHSHVERVGNGAAGAILMVPQASYNASTGFDSNVSTQTNVPADAASAHNNLQPYIVKYVWQRTA
jgi:microcystin-dependent protein